MDHNLLFAEIDRLYPEYLRIWEDVCNIESPTSYKEGVDRAGEYFIQMAKSRGWDVEVFNQPTAGNAITITLNRNSDAAPIVLSGHLDTVHPISAFSYPPTKNDGERIYGPGVVDCKGGIVASFLAMDALDRCGFNGRPIHLILQTDEETGSVTSNHKTIEYMCRTAKSAIAFLNTEPAHPGKIIVGRKGIIRYEFTVHGIAGHSSTCYNSSNAIAEAAHKILELEKMKNPDGVTCNCGVIHGGSTPNTVAESCIFTADLRFCDEKQLEWIREKNKRDSKRYCDQRM